MAAEEKDDGLPLGGLFKHSAIYSAAPLLRQLISIGMHRLYTGWLGPAGIGVKEIADFWLIALQQLLGQNALSAMVRFYFDQKSQADRNRVVTSCTLLVSAVAWAVCIPAFLFREQLVPAMLGRGGEVPQAELVRILGLILLLIPFQLSTVSGTYYLLALKRSGLYTGIQVGKLLFEVGLNFWLIGALDMGVRGFLLSMLAGEALTSLLLCGWILATLRPAVEWRVLRPVLVYAAPLIPVGFCQLALHQVDRRLLLFFGEPGTAQSITGIYGHGYKISYLVTAMMLGPFLQIWLPTAFGIKDAGERARLLARVSTYAVLGIAATSLGVVLFGRQAAVLLAGDPAFWEAYKIIPVVAAGYVFWALYQVSQVPLLIAKRTGRIFVINVLAVSMNVLLNAWLIPVHGFVGAGVATLATFVFLAFLGMLASRSEAHVPFELGRLGATTLCVVAGGAFALWIDVRDAGAGIAVWQALAWKAGALLLLWSALWVGVLRPAERRSLLGWYAARRGGGGGR